MVCTSRRKSSFILDKVEYNKYATVGEPIRVVVTIQNVHTLLADNFKCLVYLNGEEVQSEGGWLNPGNVFEFVYGFVPKTAGRYNIQIDVLDDLFLTGDRCEDYKNFSITVLEPGESVIEEQFGQNILVYAFAGIVILSLAAYAMTR